MTASRHAGHATVVDPTNGLTSNASTNRSACYRLPPGLDIDPLLPVPVAPQDQAGLIDFMANGLTDPRVRDQAFPFDQPATHDGTRPQLSFSADKATISWPLLQGVPAYVMYRGNLSDLSDVDHDGLPDLGYGVYEDGQTPGEGQGFFYVKGVKDGGTIRGLGVTSAVKQRVPTVSCP